jgi:hypothetical protein
MALEPKVDIAGLYNKNNGLPTCTKEKHRDVVDSLRCRQLEGSLGFVDLLQIRLQKPSRYTAAKHCFGDMEGVNEMMDIVSLLCPRRLWQTIPARRHLNKNTTSTALTPVNCPAASRHSRGSQNDLSESESTRVHVSIDTYPSQDTFTTMPSLRSQSYVFDARPHYPLLVSVKRYWVPGFESKDADAATLVLTHATSFHKELWEPVLGELYDRMADAFVISSPAPKIRDAWAIDCPNHGESAILNEETLLSGYTPICKFYASLIEGIAQFTCANLYGQSHGGSMRGHYISFSMGSAKA